ncbi:thiamine pyrophosphate-dependent enzyme, partial [Salmonella enterica subsp. enterica serovar Virginia]|nr:thiamine pyrophosphate-dependent enzyme [Salmonella enterica subsp. enterica serovar Virginia]
VKMALPKEMVVCVTGDGSIQMNIQELSTALQYELPVLVLNLNSAGFFFDQRSRGNNHASVEVRRYISGKCRTFSACCRYSG